MQGICTLSLYDALSEEGGDDFFATWFVKLFGEDMLTYRQAHSEYRGPNQLREIDVES